MSAPKTPQERLCAAISAAWPGNEWTFAETPWASVNFTGVRMVFAFREPIELTDGDTLSMERAVAPCLIVDATQTNKNALELLVLDA